MSDKPEDVVEGSAEEEEEEEEDNEDGEFWIDDNGEFYSKAKDYWSKISPTVDGMLGGFEQISPTDINGSKAFLRPFLKVGNGKTNNHRALDCGAGIGRITKRLLLPMFDKVDMVELNQKFLDAGHSFLGDKASRVEKFICCGLQDFTPEPGRYDLIWSQWVLGHLTDEDLVDYFKRCQLGLSAEGIIVVKENFTSSGSYEFDREDSSFTRPRHKMEDIMQKAGLTIIKSQKQKGFPKGLYEVYMYALK